MGSTDGGVFSNYAWDGLLIWMWKLRTWQHLPASAVETGASAGALQERIRRETEY